MPHRTAHVAPEPGFLTRRQAARPRDSRRTTASILGVHPDSITRLLRDGLASAVLQWGGHGKEMSFSRPLVLRWAGARHCPCARCRMVLEDCQVAGEHLITHRHGALEPCDDGPEWAWKRLAVPCDWPEDADAPAPRGSAETLEP
jgi:hypothetical protein